jgi:hypothetical protein
MSSEDRKLAYLKGYERGLKDALVEVQRIASRGYSATEMSYLLKTTMATLRRNVATMGERIDQGKVDVGGPTPVAHLGKQPGAYVIREERPDAVFELAKGLRLAGVRTLSISRIHPEDIVRRHEFKSTRFLWLTGTRDPPTAKNVEHTRATDLVGLIAAVDRFLKGGRGTAAVALEGGDYLVSQNGFSSLLRCVQQVNEKTRARGAFFLMSVDPRTMGEREYGLLAKEIGTEL